MESGKQCGYREWEQGTGYGNGYIRFLEAAQGGSGIGEV